MSANLLVELFTEELPPKALRTLGEAFAASIRNSLVAAQLAAPTKQGTVVFATPRRLAVLVPDVATQARDRAESKKLMPAKVAFDVDGKPAQALVKRLAKEGASADQVQRRTEGSTEYAYLEQTIRGVTLATGVQNALLEAIAKLPIPKVMSYQLADGTTTVHFVRPAHGLVALHGADIVPVSALGLAAGRITHGHRFLGVKDITLASADAYEEALAAHGSVIAQFDRRRDEIRRQLDEHAARLRYSLGPDADVLPLLDEVTALVEHPTVYVGKFESEFLVVPQECLILTMRQNQKYFPLFDAGAKLTNKFLIVSNMWLSDPENVIEGNQRVIRPRLADARFFFETDKKTRLEERVPQLASIIYHNKLGNQLERTQRVQLLAGKLARLIGADPAMAERAAWLAKADLVTNMVGEFPELQGVMGRYYAINDGEPEAVADAINQHYRPRFAGDRLPEGKIDMAVALADKLETLAGMFGIGQQPTGDKDPFALRRQALGVIRILVEASLPLALHEVVDAAFTAFPGCLLKDARSELQNFVWERLRGHQRDAGYSANEVEAVLCMKPPVLARIPSQLAAVRAFASLPEAESLAAANKRVANILKQAEAKGISFEKTAPDRFKEPAEHALFDALRNASQLATPLYEQGDYTGYLKAFAVLKTPVDAFFDAVMVMVEDADLRNNRLALLAELRTEMNRIADISQLAS